MFANGEIVNKYSKFCVDTKGYDGSGRIYSWPCQSLRDQMWEDILILDNGYAIMLKNKEAGLCIGIDNKGRIVT